MWRRLLELLRDEGGWLRRPLGAVLVAVAVGSAGTAIIIRHIEGGAAFTCDLNATVANFASQVTASSNGQTICLTEASNYGTWTGTSKSITISPSTEDLTPSISLNLGNGDANFTIDGRLSAWDDTTSLSIGPSDFTGTPGPQDITIKNFKIVPGSAAGGFFEIDGPTNTDIVIDHGVFYDLPGDPNNEAAIRFPYDGPAYVTIQNSLFRDMASDGIKIGASHVSVLNNKFLRITCSNCGLQHTDNIQLCCGYSSGSDTGGGAATIVGNIFENGGATAEQAGPSAFDGTGNNYVAHNVVRNFSAWGMAFAGDSPGSTVEWNTVGNASVGCGSKTGDPTSTTVFHNNIFQTGIDTGGIGAPAGPTCTPTTDHQFNSTPTFVGGSGSQMTMAEYCLSGPSGALTGASDGGQVGACGNGYTGGPPTGEGY